MIEPKPRPEREDLICEIRLSTGDRLRLEIDGLRVDGKSSLSPALADEVAESKDPKKAGALLFDALLPEGEPALEAYRKITSELRLMGARQCVRLQIEPGAPEYLHGLPWELLYDPRRRIGLGCSPEVSFLRVVDTDRPLPPPIEGPLRMLLAVAAPDDALHHNLPRLDRRFAERALVSALRRLQDLAVCEVLETPVTAERLGARLADGTFHALHLIAHGRRLPHEPRARVLLQDDDGKGAWTDAETWIRLLSGDPELHLVTLMACHDGIETRADPFYGLGATLAGPGAPAVVTTRRALTVSQAAKVTAHLYRGLALTGRIDEAVNEARERLYLSRPERFTWAVPVAYLAGDDPYLWHSEESRRLKVEEDTQSLEMAQFRLEQQRREHLAAIAEEPPPPRPAPRIPWGWAALLVSLLAVGLGWAAGRWTAPGEMAILENDRRPRQSVDPEATRRALPRYASACDGGQALACARLGTIYELGRGVQKDLTAAESYYRRACTGGDPASCYHLGHLLESPSQSRFRDRLRGRSDRDAGEKIRELYTSACDGGEDRACRRLQVLRAQEAVPEAVLADRALDDGGPAPAEVFAADLGVTGSGSGATRSGATGSGATGSGATGSGATGSEPSPPDRANPGTPEGDASAVTTVVDRAYVDGTFREASAAPSTAPAPRSNEGDTWVYEVGGTGSLATAAGSARGNVYRVFETARLLAWDVWLDFADAQDLTFSVHVGDANLGSYTQIFERSVTVEGRGADWYSSGELDLPLEADRYYLVAVSWNGEATYAFSSSGPRRTFFAELTHGHVDLDPILPDVESEVEDLAAYRQRLLTAHPVTVDGVVREAPEATLADALTRDLDPAVSGPAGETVSLELGADAFAAAPPTEVSGGAHRGNVVRLERPVRLRGLAVWLDPAAPPSLGVTIYRSTDGGEAFEPVHRATWTPANAGARWYRSPAFDLELPAGTDIAVVFDWDVPAGYRYGVGGLQESPVGPVLHGLGDAGPAPVGSFSAPSPDRAVYLQRWHLASDGERADGERVDGERADGERTDTGVPGAF